MFVVELENIEECEEECLDRIIHNLTPIKYFGGLAEKYRSKCKRNYIGITLNIQLYSHFFPLNIFYLEHLPCIDYISEMWFLKTKEIPILWLPKN